MRIIFIIIKLADKKKEYTIQCKWGEREGGNGCDDVRRDVRGRKAKWERVRER